MKILVVSDTHGRNTNLKKVLEQVNPIDLLIHAGDIEVGKEEIEQLVDCPTHIVAGNNDMFVDLPKEKIFEVGKYRIWLTHGHHYVVAFGTKYIKKEALKRNVDIVIYGHTHIPLLEYHNGLTILNPGSITLPRQEGYKPSYAILDLDDQGNMHYTSRFLERN